MAFCLLHSNEHIDNRQASSPSFKPYMNLASSLCQFRTCIN